MTKLDHQQIAQYDSAGMLDRILNFPEQLKQAQTISKQTKLNLSSNQILNVCITGMGGSAISGDIVRSNLAGRLNVPIFVNRYYKLPNFVNENSLIVVSSYSGNTEETLEAYEDACKKNAQVVCITSGGELSERAHAQGHPIFTIPGGYPPRSALGYLTVPILYGLHAAKLITEPDEELFETINLLQKLSQEYHPDSESNLAKEISIRLQGKIPLIYASVFGFEAVAWRWKGQFSENSKVLAFCNLFPELNHNEIMGWGPLREINQKFQIIYLKDKEDHPQVIKRMMVTKEIIEPETGPIIEVESKGESLLARIFSLIFLGDVVSLYLAILNKVDPTPVKRIDYLKQKLSEA